MFPTRVIKAVPYYDLPDAIVDALDAALDCAAGGNHRRLDVAVLDEAGDVVIGVEAERINNDRHDAIPADYRKLAACDPLEAIYLVFGHSAAHALVDILHDAGLVEKTYADNFDPTEFTFDTLGLTTVHIVFHLLDHVSFGE